MKELLLSILKYISLPFALLYGLMVTLRNWFYDLEIFSSIEFDLPVICVGNITVGGTGKSPHIEYLIEQQNEPLVNQKYGDLISFFQENIPTVLKLNVLTC